ncbi:hypothetical protein CJ030_MR3G012022 [Morella rubra]|uniref:Uncharacterized protein n=1 Tax=Morella rubra TaxID=262757 RepID=A0A6A1W4N4_9ROSI|nr:hypothetical protein CJ030_MR3G012022 [Morella rubra]
MVMPTHMLCKDFHTRLANLETKFALSDRAVTEELNAIRMELLAVRDYVSQLHQSLHIVSIQIRTLIKRVDVMEEQLEHVRDAVRQDLDESVCRCDSN